MKATFLRISATVIYAVLVISLLPAPAGAYPVFGELWHLRQPDGETLEVKVWGDEFYQVVESLDGYTLVRDPETGVICYARLSADGTRLESSGMRAGTAGPLALRLPKHLRIDRGSRARMVDEVRNARRSIGAEGIGITGPSASSQAQNPIIGNVTGLLILVDFDDQVATIPRDDVAGMFNEPGYNLYDNNGSVNDYFHDVSDGLLDYINNVSSAYYRAQYPFTHYDNCDYQMHEGAIELMVEVLDYMEAAGHDFSQYDNNGDGYIDALSLMYAGHTACGWARGMWSGSGGIKDLWSADGVSTFRYLVVGMGETLGIGAFCHESGHMICGWPDLYDYDGDSKGVGMYCLMANFASRTNPVEPCAYLKYLAGWGDVFDLSAPAMGLPLAASSSNVMYKYQNPWFTNEYFLIENRRQIGRDAEIPDHGLALWQIDTNGFNSWNQRTPTYHYEVTLVQADNQWDLETNINSGDDTDLYAAPTYTRITPCSEPDTDWWNGVASDLYIKNISESATTMSFDFALGDPPTLAGAGIESVGRTTSDWTIWIALENTSFDDAYNVNAVLYSGAAWLTIPDPNCAYNTIPSGTSSLGAPDQYVLNLEAWPGGSFDVALYVTWEGECGGSYSDLILETVDPSTVTPVAFSDLSARITGDAIELRWAVAADEDFEGFNVYRSRADGVPNVLLNTSEPLEPALRSYVDSKIEPGVTYRYQIAAVMTGGSEIRSFSIEATAGVPTARLEQNQPNPFSASTRVDYQIHSEAHVALRVYDVAGRLVRTLVDRIQPSGAYSVTWKGKDARGRLLPSGVYFYKIKAGSFQQSRRLLIVR